MNEETGSVIERERNTAIHHGNVHVNYSLHKVKLELQNIDD